MKKSIIIDSLDKMDIAFRVCRAMFEDRGTQEVIIQDYEQTRSIAQNRLMWKWNTEYAEFNGWHTEEAHTHFKERISVVIFCRDDAGYAAMVEAVKDVRRAGLNAQADALKKKILDLTSTTDYKVSQMSEHLTQMELIAKDRGCIFTHPDDIYLDAMGVKR